MVICLQLIYRDYRVHPVSVDILIFLYKKGIIMDRPFFLFCVRIAGKISKLLNNSR